MLPPAAWRRADPRMGGEDLEEAFHAQDPEVIAAQVMGQEAAFFGRQMSPQEPASIARLVRRWKESAGDDFGDGAAVDDGAALAALRALPVRPMCGWRDPWLARAPRTVQPSLASTKEAAQKTSWSSDALLQFGL